MIRSNTLDTQECSAGRSTVSRKRRASRELEPQMGGELVRLVLIASGAAATGTVYVKAI